MFAWEGSSFRWTGRTGSSTCSRSGTSPCRWARPRACWCGPRACRWPSPARWSTRWCGPTRGWPGARPTTSRSPPGRRCALALEQAVVLRRRPGDDGPRPRRPHRRDRRRPHRGLELDGTFERLVDPGVPLPRAISRLTGIEPRDLRGRGPVGPALDAFLEFAGDAVLVAHNARFDTAFLDARAAPARRHAPGLPRRRHGGAGPPRARAGAAPPVAAQPQRALRHDASSPATARWRTRRRPRRSCSCCSAAPRSAERAPSTTCWRSARRRGGGSRARGHLAEAAPRAPGTYVMRTRSGVPLYVGTAGRPARARALVLPRRRGRPATGPSTRCCRPSSASTTPGRARRSRRGWTSSR